MAETFVHPTAVVDADVTLGPGVRIWHFVHVSEGAVIGADTALGQNVFIGKQVRVGARVKVQNNVSLYEGVEIADDVFLGPSCVFTNVVNPRAFVVRRHAFRATRVDTGASVGANATVVCGHSIGAYAFVAAGATVTRDVPAYALVMGTPARRTGWMCRCGEQLPSQRGHVGCESCGAAYQVDAHTCQPAELAQWSVAATAPGSVFCPGSGPSCSPGLGPAARADPDPSQNPRRHPPSSQPTTALAPDAPVPLLDLAAQHAPLRGALRAAFERVLDSDQYILGPEVAALEQSLCEQLGFAHAVSVSSGTDALLLALMALEIGPGDEVITTPFSFFATAGCIARLGARPVFVDIDPLTYNLDPQRVEAAVTAQTRAVMPVHLFGGPADLTALVALCRRHRLALIEDAAQALGASHAGVSVGTAGSFGCFSFFPSKNLGGFGDGGFVTTGDPELAARARLLRAHGAQPKYHHARIGGNFRLDALQAALLRVKLPHLPEYTAARRAHAAFYDARLSTLRGAGLVTPAPDPGHVYNQYVIRSPQRDALREALATRRIGSEIYYPECLHLQACFASLGYRAGALPHAEAATREVLAIPVYPELTAAQRERVVRALEDAVQTARA